MNSAHLSSIPTLVAKTILFVLLAACRSVSFENVDLQPIVLQPEDLPAVLAGGANGPLEQDDYFNYAIAYQQTIMVLSGEAVGDARIYLFHDTEDRDRMYDFLALTETPEGITPFPAPPIGDNSVARQGNTPSGAARIDLTFERCHAVVHVWLYTNDDFNLKGSDIVTYARKLDARVRTVACP